MGILAGAIIGGLGSALIGGYSSNRAAKAQEAASRAGIAEQRRQFDTLLRLNQPYIGAGTNAVNELSRLFGYQPMISAPAQSSSLGENSSLVQLLRRRLEGEPQNELIPADPNAPMGMDVFQASPDYEFRRSEGLEGIAQTLGAGGQGAFSGNALRGLNQFNSNLASGEFDNFVQRRLALAGLGGANTQQTGSAAINTGQNIAGLYQAGGNARASGILGQGLAVNQGMNGILQAIMLRNMGLAGGGTPYAVANAVGPNSLVAPPRSRYG